MTAVIAHRGDWAEGRPPRLQNSTEAALQALEAGADGVEVDARLTLDGQVVLHHDSLLGVDDRAAGCDLDVGTAICAATRAELHHLATLAELLEALSRWPGAVLNVEMKDLPGEPGWDASYPLVHEVARALTHSGAGEWPGPQAEAALRVIVSSFDPGALRELKQVAPALSTGLLVGKGATWSLEPGLRAVHPAEADASPALFERASQAGLAVVPWTVDDPARAAQLARLGAAAIITNRPRALRSALAAAL
jgi:glycerophosphoryl diester phosphodiesterase